MNIRSEVNTALTTLVVLLAIIFGLSYLLEMGNFYEKYPEVKLFGQWVAIIVLVFWVAPVWVRYIAKQIALGRQDAEKENRDEN